MGLCISSAAAFSQQSLGDWLSSWTSVCHQTFFKLLLLPTVFDWFPRKFPHMIYVPICNNL